MGSRHFPSNLEMRHKGGGYADLRRLKSIAKKYLGYRSFIFYRVVGGKSVPIYSRLNYVIHTLENVLALYVPRLSWIF
jgi:hypothetical protein